MSKKISVNEKLKELCANLEECYARWNKIIDEGCSDPNWADGVNLNLVRNHIIFFKRSITKLCEENSLTVPEIVNKPTPKEVSSDYMVNAEGIKKDALKLIDYLESGDEISYLSDNLSRLTEKEKAKTNAAHIFTRYTALKKAVKDNNLVYMRCILNSKGWFIESVAKAVEDIQTVLNSSTREFSPVQMSLF